MEKDIVGGFTEGACFIHVRTDPRHSCSESVRFKHTVDLLFSTRTCPI